MSSAILYHLVPGVGGPVALYFIFLEVFLELGWFDEELAMGITKSELGRGWGVVTATDIVLAWLIGTYLAWYTQHEGQG